MKRRRKALLIFTLLFILIFSTLSYGDVGNHNSYDNSDWDFDFDSDSGGELGDIIGFILFFIRSPWYIKLLLVGVIVGIVLFCVLKDRLIRRKYLKCDKSFLRGLDTKEEELKEIARKMILSKYGENTKIDFVGISNFEKDDHSHKITFLIGFHEAFRYVLLELSHRAIDGGRYDDQGFEVLSIKDIKK